MKKCLPILFIFCAAVCVGQPVIVWQQCFQGDVYDTRTCSKTSEGGYILSGSDASVQGNHGGSDLWLAKVDGSGNLQWEKSFGGSSCDYGNAAVQTADGGFIAVGATCSIDGDVTGNHDTTGGSPIDIWVVKTDSTGNLQWAKCYGGAGEDVGRSVQQSSDGGYLIAGYATSNDSNVPGNHNVPWYLTSDYLIIKTDSMGNIIWQKCFGGYFTEDAYKIIQTNDGGLLVGGKSFSSDGDVSENNGAADFWLLKLDTLGHIIWQKTYGGSNTDELTDLIQSADSGFLAAGITYSNDSDVTGNHGDFDCWIVKTDRTGSLQWSKCFGGSGTDYLGGVSATADHGYVICCSTNSNDGDVNGLRGMWDLWVFKLDSAGNLTWQKCLGGSNVENGQAIGEISAGNYIALGEVASDDFDVTCYHDTSPALNAWLIKLSIDTLNASVYETISNKIHLSPNPTTSFLKIETAQNIDRIELFNLLGEKIPVAADCQLKTVDCELLPPGIYILRASGEENVWIGKVMKE